MTKNGVAGIGVAAFAVVCCAALPLLAALIGGLTAGAVAGIGAGAVAGIGLFVLARSARRRRAGQSPTERSG